eukprot:Tbor_TRINITY_DN6231_c9_g1::TRINITY_DN6231_c9_g1_i6::g.1745::m.1745
MAIKDMFLHTSLISRGKMIPIALQSIGVRAFAISNFLKVIQERVTELPQGNNLWVLYNNYDKGPKKTVKIPSKTEIFKKETLTFGVLYVPESHTFPVLDGLFFVDQPKTIVGIQTTVSCTHHTTTSKVKALREYLSCFFVDWEEFSKDLSWEIVYVQH